MDTQGFESDIINLIADNLRDRYANGFPILKELIQNADDAGAPTFVFGQHPGFREAASHPLLQGPGLWFFNDGAFDHRRDKRALSSFGINSKAGDAGTIGKFGLGMKSVFHLCETLFYVAWDGGTTHFEILNPWKTMHGNVHPEWDGYPESDGACLIHLARSLATDRASGFLLWVPLRRRVHLVREGAPDAGAIIERFPGDDPTADLAFLRDPGLTHDLAEVLPLLQHLRVIEHRDEVNPFVLRLDTESRLIAAQAPTGETHGTIADAAGSVVLRFAGMKRTEAGSWAQTLKTAHKWPKSRYRDENGHDCIGEDKTRAEGAVLFCSATDKTRPVNLHWAVFLPLEEGAEPLLFDGARPGHSLVLHGQFFVDAGRRKVHDQHRLHEPASDLLQAGADDAMLRQTWNRRLAQEVLAPQVIPALEHYVRQQGLNDRECGGLTRALAESDWFCQFRGHVCATDAWVRVLEQDGPRWRRIPKADRERLRPVPTPTKGDPGRPWAVLPSLSELNLFLCDSDAPSLMHGQSQWQEAELDRLLDRATGLFQDGPSMDYLCSLLESQAKPFLGATQIQARLVRLLRTALEATDRTGRQGFAKIGKGLIEKLHQDRRLDLSADLPDRILRDLWASDAPILLVPNGLVPDPGKAVPDDTTLRSWLGILDEAVAAAGSDGIEPLLNAIQGILRPLDPERRGRFLRDNGSLRIIAVRDPDTGRNRAASATEIRAVREAGALFGFAQSNLEQERLGLTPFLARAIPEARIWLVRAEIYRDLLPGEPPLPRADDPVACLAAVGRYATGQLGGLRERQALLEKANDAASDRIAQRGLRYLLHGSAEHREADGVTLWFPEHRQHPAWEALWDQLHGFETWCRITATLADTLPRSRWDAAGAQEIEASTLIDELHRLITTNSAGPAIPSPEKLGIEERNEILAHIEHKDLWLRLPLHTRLDGEPVAADRELAYLAPVDQVADDALTRAATLIRRARDPRVAKQQQEWLRPLDQCARIELALAQPDPSVHWHSILDAMAQFDTDPSPHLARRLIETAWLPTVQGHPVKPEDVIDLRGCLAEKAQYLVEAHRAANGHCYATIADIAEGPVKHPAWDRQGRGLCAWGDAGLKRLGLLLSDLPDHAIGPWDKAPNEAELALLARCPHLPAWHLLWLAQEAASGFDAETVWSALGDGLTKPPTKPPTCRQLIDTLAWLSEDVTVWKVRKALFDRHLGWLKETSEFNRETLSGLRLASVKRRWQTADRLCAGAHDIDEAHLLDRDQWAILASAIRRADTGGIEAEEMASHHTRTAFDNALKTSKATLSGYFKPWEGGWVPEPMIGLVLGVLSYQELAASYLHQRPLDLLLSEIPWVDPGGDIMHRNWMHGFSRDQLMTKIQVAVQVPEGDHVEVPNLLGDWIQAPIAREVKSLLVGGIHWMGGYRALLQLRPVDPGTLGEEGASRLLKILAETVYAGLYNQPPSDFHALWQDLGHSDQVQVRVARRLILDNALLYLRTFPTDHQDLRSALALCDDWRHRVAEVEDKGRDARQERDGQRLAMESLACLIDRNREVAASILTGVRSKLAQYQYDLSSIPFELFQNADDAVVELAQMAAHPGDGSALSPGARRVVVESDDASLRLLHWGRPINAWGPPGFGGEARGFGRDLEKMLVLSASDKEPGHGVTGKFGLGFKSVLLACDRPRIVSGQLAFEVVAGILPESWSDCASTREALNRSAPLELHGRGTLIELAGIDPGKRGQALARFRTLAGILCVFGRAVRKIQLRDGQVPSDFAWEPRVITLDAELGRLLLKDDRKDGWGAETDALCLRTDVGAILLALGPKGFRALPKETPALWVTAPLRETDGLGFACTAAFDLDAGRARLAGDSQRNLGVARQLGAAAGDVLGALFDQGCADWPIQRRDLGLLANLDRSDLWLSLWTCLTERWLSRRDAAATLGRALALALLERLSARPGAVPNGLPGPLGGLVERAEVSFQLDNALATPEVIAILADWARFSIRYPRRCLVSERIGTILHEGDMAKLARLGLASLAAVIDPTEVTPEDAKALGGIRLLTEDEGWGDPDLKQRVRNLRFRTAADTWAEAARLVASGQGIEKDEALRHAFAPLSRRLHPEYWQDDDGAEARLAFFILARERKQPDTGDLANWMLAADTPDLQRAALRYLSDGDLGQSVAERVNSQGWLPTALHDPILVAGLDSTQIQRLQARLASASQLKQIWQPPETIYTRPRVDLGTALMRIADWWDAAKSQEEPRHRQDLFPPGQLDLTKGEDGHIRDRSAWFTLFAIAAFQAIPRTQGQQHLGFIRKCMETEYQGEDSAGETWWEVFSNLDPKLYPEKWLGIIEQYAEAQHEDERWTQWIAQFPKLYKLRRWMDDYVDLFLSIDRFKEPFELSDLLAPRTNPHFQRGGIEPPPLTRTLRVGGPLVIRELLHHGVIQKSPLAVPHAYAPIERIQIWFKGFGEFVDTSRDIHALLCEHLDEEEATFGGAYDIPLRILTADEDLQRSLLT